ncbi:hypothetical protein BaRGS_00012419 [Batillaria attramentaria]|uniref:C-type lectin domain-containing protein n=1 Tax=Batillaria attramentaria TaxID=370345 RepID=A0ABD0LAU9_9CAEN
MNRTVAVLLMLCAVANRAERSKTQVTGLATRYGCLDNREFSDNLLFESSAVSNTECGLKCLSHAGCVAFTTSTPSGICQGHSSVPVANSSFSPLAGAQTWTFQDGLQNTLLWLDAVEEVEGGNWLWGDGHITPRDSSMWYPSEPNNLGGADCMQTLGDYSLDDAPCENLVKYVCEMSIP